jgi:hypothetical protein
MIEPATVQQGCTAGCCVLLVVAACGLRLVALLANGLSWWAWCVVCALERYTLGACVRIVCDL